MKKIFSFITALLFAGSMMATTVTKTVAELASEHSFTSGAVCTPFALDEVITVSTDATDANTGKYYSNGEQIRLYQTGAAKLILTAAEGYKISSVTLEYASQNTGILVEAASGEAVAFENVQSATFNVGNSGSATNGQARITSFSVTYDAEGGEEPGDEPGENVLSGALSGTEATYSFEYEFATTEDMQLEVTGLLEITGEVVGMVPQIFINNAYAGNFTYDAGVCSFTSADAYEAGAELDIYFYFAYAGGATATDHVAYTIETPAVEPVVYYIKSKWAEDATDWTWQPMTEESEGVWVYDGTFYGTGVNINTKADDDGNVWYPLGEAYEGHQLEGEIEAGQNVHFVYNVEAGTVTATAIVEPEITTCAQAAEAALSVSDNNVEYNNGAEYTIEGYVTAIQTAFSERFSNISFWMADTKDGGNVLEAYRAACASADDAPAVGDKVAVTGKLTKYNETPEFAAGCTFVILEKGEVIPEEPAQNLGQKTIAEFLELKNLKDTCILTGVVSNIVNDTYGNFDLTDETGTVYVYGLLTPAGESQKFADLNVAENDTLTILAIYNEYNSNPQAKNAIFVEVKKYVEPVVFSHELYGSEELPAIGHTYFATTNSWAADGDSHAEIVNDYDVHVVLVNSKEAEWQSQVFVNPGFTWEVGAYYKMEFDLTTNHQLGGVHVKVNNNNDNYFYDSYPNDNLFLADQTTHFVADSIYAMAEPTDGGQLIFSVGWCDANTEILISNIVITKYETPVVEDAFTITVENIAAASADITVTPANDNIAYYWNFTKAESFDIAQIGKSNLDSYIEYLTSLYAQYGMEMEFTYADIATKGADSYSATSLDPATEYVVYAFGYDTITGELTTAVATQSFTTVTVPASENVITLTYDTKLNITTTNTDDYMVLIELKEDYDNYEPDMTQASLNAEVDSWDFQDPSARILSGNKSVDPASYYISETQGAVVEAGKEYIALVYPYSTEDGVRNGDVVALVFTYVAPVTALENIELVEKTTKVVSDGQVLIIRDAKMFNVLGARIR